MGDVLWCVQELNGDEEGDEDEEEVVVMGSNQFSAEEIAEAEARFEETYGKQLGTGGEAAAPSIATTDGEPGPVPVHILPLYAMLPQVRPTQSPTTIPCWPTELYIFIVRWLLRRYCNVCAAISAICTVN